MKKLFLWGGIILIIYILTWPIVLSIDISPSHEIIFFIGLSILPSFTIFLINTKLSKDIQKTVSDSEKNKKYASHFGLYFCINQLEKYGNLLQDLIDDEELSSEYVKELVVPLYVGEQGAIKHIEIFEKLYLTNFSSLGFGETWDSNHSYIDILDFIDRIKKHLISKDDLDESFAKQYIGYLETLHQIILAITSNDKKLLKLICDLYPSSKELYERTTSKNEKMWREAKERKKSKKHN